MYGALNKGLLRFCDTIFIELDIDNATLHKAKEVAAAWEPTPYFTHEGVRVGHEPIKGALTNQGFDL